MISQEQKKGNYVNYEIRKFQPAYIDKKMMSNFCRTLTLDKKKVFLSA